MAEIVLGGELEIRATADGGRRHPIVSGHRSAISFGASGPHGEPVLHSCVVEVVARRHVEPGGRARVWLRPLELGSWPAVRPGTAFDLMEGARVVGAGRITSVEIVGAVAERR